jgi:hypothetical protein
MCTVQNGQNVQEASKPMTINLRKSLFLAPFCAAIVAIAAAFVAHAAITPTLSLSNFGNNNEVQATITGDPSASVSLYYYTESEPLGQDVGVIGYTSSNENLSASIPYGQYNIPSGADVYVVIDGAASQAEAWPYDSNTYTNNSYAISFSQNSIALAPGQTMSVTLYGGSGSYYVSQNSSLVSASISGDTLSVSGVTAGSGTLVICSSYDSCGTLSLTVASSAYTYPYSTYTYPYTTPSYPTYQAYTPVSLSKSSLTLNAGQQEYLNIYGN